MIPELKFKTQYFNNTHKEKYYDAWYYVGEDGHPVYHKEDGPACIYYYITGQIVEKWYGIHGKVHRTDGPAKIFYDRQGNIIKEEFYLNNKQLTEDEYKIFVFAFHSEFK